MPTPKIEKEVRDFLCCINYIDRFIAELTTTCEPLFKLFEAMYQWFGMMIVRSPSKDLGKSIESLVLVPLVFRRPLLMYLAIHDSPTSACLVSMTERVRRSKQLLLEKKFMSPVILS